MQDVIETQVQLSTYPLRNSIHDSLSSTAQHDLTLDNAVRAPAFLGAGQGLLHTASVLLTELCALSCTQTTRTAQHNSSVGHAARQWLRSVSQAQGVYSLPIWPF